MIGIYELLIVDANVHRQCIRLTREFFGLTCAFQPVALLVRALVAVDVAVAELGQLQELQHVRRLVHLAPEVAILQVQEEHFSPQSVAESSD